MKVFLVLISCFSLAFCQPFLDYSDYYNAMLDYALYDYYDWVCVDRTCQLCDLLTGDCCNPARGPNCFLPDSCANNPCLAGGTCITTRTVDDRPDFVCTCKKGLTGKYCQLIDEYDPPITMAIVPPVAPLPVPGPAPFPAPAPVPTVPRQTGYGQMQPQMNQMQPQMNQMQPQMNQMQPMQPQMQFGSAFGVQQPTQQQPFGMGIRRTRRSLA